LPKSEHVVLLYSQIHVQLVSELAGRHTYLQVSPDIFLF